MQTEARATHRLGTREQRLELAKALKKARRDIYEPAKRGLDIDYWPVKNSGLSSYEETFKLIGVPISEYARKFPNLTVVDLLSSTTAIRELFLFTTQGNTSGISVGLKDNRRENIRELDKSLGIKHIEGDLTQPKTWKEVKKTLGLKKADIVISRGYAGTANLPASTGYFLYAVNNIWNMLADGHGMFFAEFFSARINREEIWNWVGTMQMNGIDARATEYTLMISKRAQSPSVLPRPS